MTLDTVIRRADLGDGRGPVDIGIAGTRIAAIAPALACEAAEIDFGGPPRPARPRRHPHPPR